MSASDVGTRSARAAEDDAIKAKPQAAEPEPISPGIRTLVTICTILATLMQSLDSTIANVALPYMQGTMSASQDEINWVLTSYIVAAAIMTTPTGFLAARFGRTRLFVTAVSGFTVASILCGMADSLPEIVIFRVIQGVFGASLVPLSQSVMYDIYPVEQRGAAMAIWTMGVMVGPICGPILGGWLTENESWRWVFYINVPFGIVTVLGLLAFLKETPHGNVVRLDWIGFGALSLAIGAFQTMLDRGETLDWFASNEIILEAVLAGVGFYIFLVQFFLGRRPFLSPVLFTDRNFVVGITLYFTLGLIMYATLALLAPYLQTLMGYPVVTAGIVLAPRGAGLMLAAMFCGRVIRRVSPRLLVGVGFATGAYALHLMTSWTPDVAETTMIAVGFLQGLSIGFMNIPINIITFATLPATLRTEAAGIYSLMRNLGSAIGISVTGSLLVSNTQVNHALIAGSVTPFNRMLHIGAAARLWNPATAKGIAMLNEEVTRQAQTIAYIDDFKLMLVLAIAVMPLLLLTRSPSSAVGK
ncbi:MAG TPA: DHA2 family efflux MFS transporter permease subunit [Rhodopila sp.]|uniref:DHA2 family efflux MFS transporter permease subunit n=1 Tax=Rhodopila sp. TaxID=2480087 RepID=UPI002C01FB1C|nr:DHA2 family efflux MFS transporter permease subunit [Rhodopila sp.]HVY14606.1 DHA2 family efflux MFS transporter permease subunit [Rhodopila sp.]